MKLYNLTVRRSDAIDAAVVCNLILSPSSPGVTVECLVWTRGSWLEVIQLSNQDRLELVWRCNCFDVIRNLSAVKAPSEGVSDQLMMVLSSGELRRLGWNTREMSFKQLDSMHLDHKGSSRTAPLEYLVTDPHGRMAVALAIESTRKAVRLPLAVEDESVVVDATLPNMFCYTAQSVDRGQDSPSFVTLERLRLQDSKYLTLYELNMGLNHILKDWTTEVPNDTNFIVDMGSDRLVLFSDSIIMLLISGKIVATQSIDDNSFANHIIVATVKVTSSLVLMQLSDTTLVWLDISDSKLVMGKVTVTEDGNNEEDEAEDAAEGGEQCRHATMSLFRSMVTLKSGFVFGIAELGDHLVMQITNLAPLSFSLAASVPNGAPLTFSSLSKSHFGIASGRNSMAKYFSFSQGLTTETLASTPLPFEPSKVLTAKRRPGDKYDGLILLTLPSSTTVLSVGEEGAVEEVTESVTGIDSNVGTLDFATLQHGSVQVHAHGLRYIIAPDDSESSSKINSWKPSGSTEVLSVAHTQSQVALVLSNKQIVYFEEALYSSELLESQHRLYLPEVASACCFAATNDLKSQGLYVALLDETVRYFELPKFKQTQLISVPYTCTSLVNPLLTNENTQNVLYIGHMNGALSEHKNGEVFTRALGSAPVQLSVLADYSVIAVSSIVWHISQKEKMTSVIPLIVNDKLKMVDDFFTKDLTGLVAITRSSLEVLEIMSDDLDSKDVILPQTQIESSVTNLLRLGQQRLLVAKHQLKWLYGDDLHFSDKIHASVLVRFAGHITDLVAVSTSKAIVIVEATFPRLTILHETPIDELCTALAPFKGYLLAALGKSIIAYSLGKRQLLRQFGSLVPNAHVIRAIRVSQDLVYVADSRSSVKVLKFDENGESPEKFRTVCVDPIPRCITRMIILDPITVCIGDQYGSISVLRAPDLAMASSEGDPSNFMMIAHYNMPDDAVVSLHKGILTPLSGGTEAIIYVGIHGSIGLLIPFITVAEIEHLDQLESLIRKTCSDNLKNHDNHQPTKNVINGDICELFYHLRPELQIDISESLGKSPQGIMNQLSAIRGRATI